MGMGIFANFFNIKLRFKIKHLVFISCLQGSIAFGGLKTPSESHCNFNLGLLLKKDAERASQELFDNIRKNKRFFSETVLDTVRIYEELIKDFPDIRDFLPPGRVLPILANEEQDFFAQQMVRLISGLERLATDEHKTWRVKIGLVLFDILDGRVTKVGAEKRVGQFLNDPSSYPLGRVLGDLRVDESLKQLIGVDYDSLDPMSLLGRYVQRTGAAHEFRDFEKTVEVVTEKTRRKKKIAHKKLFIAVSEESFPDLMEIIRAPEFFGHFHTPEQETLQILFEGKMGSYARLRNEAEFSKGSTIPLILLSTTEAQRMRQYFKLGAINDRLARTPWILEPYCERGGFEGCTQWIADMPVGDRLAQAYAFPGRTNEFAANALHQDQSLDSLPRISSLRDYELPKEFLEGFTEEQAELFNRLVHRVWRTEPAPAQFAEMLGVLKNSLKGEFSNPEKLLQVLLNETSFDRVPIVFVLVKDIKAPLSKIQ